MAFDQHREQIAFDALDTATGELSRGRIRPADRLGFRRWLSRWDGEEIEAALEATTGWRFMVEELRAVGAEVHLAEPAETSALRVVPALGDPVVGLFRATSDFAPVRRHVCGE
jgi:transposase